MVASIALAACAHNVPQDKATGPDGKVTGAKPVALAADEALFSGKDRGIVTYPGGDRIDWKLIELPPDQHGELAIKVSWRTPRPGLQVDFDVFDELRKPVMVDKTRARRVRETRIADAKGKYFVRIFAPKRGDAGAYVLAASFQPIDPKKAKVTDWAAYPGIPDPPKLADIPAGPPPPLPPQPCLVHDPLNPICAKVCAQGAPANHPPCVTPPPPPPPCTVHDAVNPNCAKVCAVNAPKTWPACRKAMVKRAIDIKMVGGEAEITIAVGDKDGVDTTWKGRVLTGKTTSPFPNGTVRIIKVDPERTVARVKITYDQAVANPNVELLPP